jgi:hypothetical protein
MVANWVEFMVEIRGEVVVVSGEERVGLMGRANRW